MVMATVLKTFKGSNMTEGRHCQVILLDGRQLEILVKPKLYAGELLDMVASHFSIKEKEYFGLAFLDDTAHHSWLNLDRRVLEHEFPKKAQDFIVLYFLVKYFVESITQLRDAATVEVFYLQAQLLVFKGVVEVDSDTSFHLAALVLQATHGDYVDDKTTREQLKKLSVIPTSVLKQHPSLPVCEEQIIGHYCKMSGQSRGLAIVNYMTIVESLPTYGVHFYEVKDKRCMPWWLGISFRGISQYDYSDRKTPRKVFVWKQLENLYFKDRKFSMEVHDVRRIPVNRRAFGPGNVVVYVWFTASPSLTKNMWSMVVAQHQFYLDRKHGKTSPPAAHNLGDIAMELSKSAQSLSSSGSSNLSRSASSHSLPALKLDNELNEQTKAAYTEMTSALKTRKDVLEVELQRKLEELQFLCLKEGELIGETSREEHGEAGQSKERNFILKDLLDTNSDQETKDRIAKLEVDLQIQSRITKAAQILASDNRASKNICRQRKLSYQRSQARLSQIEEQLAALKKCNVPPSNSSICDSSNEGSKEDHVGQELVDPPHSESGINLPEVKQDQSVTETENTEPSITKFTPSPASSSSLLMPSQHHQATLGSNSAPPSPTKYRNIHHGIRVSSTQPSTPCSGSSSRTWSQTLSGQGYTPNSVYQTRYRNQQYPILSTYSAGSDSSSGSALSLKSPYQNKFESTLNIEGSNLYSVPTQRTSQAFDSQDDILANFPPMPQEFTMMSRHNSLDSSRRHSYQKYISLLNSSPEKKEMKVSAPTPPPYAGNIDYLSSDERMKLHNHYHSPSQHCHQHTYSSQHCIHHQPYHHHHHHHHHSEQEFAYSALDSQRQVSSPIPHHHQQQHHMCQREHITSLPPNYRTETLHSSSSCYLHPPTSVPADESSTMHSDPYKFNSATLSPRSKVKVWAETSLDTHFLTHRKKTDHHEGVNIISSATGSLSPATNAPFLERQFVEKHIPTSLCSHSFSHLLHMDAKVISPGHFQPYWEETKPYEISDFYKYSVKHRKQIQQRCDQKTDKGIKQNNDSKDDLATNQTETPKSLLSEERISFDETASSSDGFHEEMLAWYQDCENVKKATLV